MKRENNNKIQNHKVIFNVSHHNTYTSHVKNQPPCNVEINNTLSFSWRSYSS